MLIYLGHLLSLILYVVVVVTAISGLIDVRKAKLYGVIKYVVPSFLISLFLQASTFIVLQIDWVFEDFNSLVGDLVAYGWLAYDYFNGFALLTFTVAIKIWLGWRLESLYEDSNPLHGGRCVRSSV